MAHPAKDPTMHALAVFMYNSGPVRMCTIVSFVLVFWPRFLFTVSAVSVQLDTQSITQARINWDRWVPQDLRLPAKTTQVELLFCKALSVLNTLSEPLTNSGVLPFLAPVGDNPTLRLPAWKSRIEAISVLTTWQLLTAQPPC